ncbi:MAG: hypothetical protein HKL96_04985 [Phycisphaerales bacterium]|nr:hypothetical protein [Phycisphaerales bacterium]
MHDFHHHFGLHPPDAFGSAFGFGLGITAAILIVGGYLVLRWQRDRQQYLLVQAAIERGLSHLPVAMPLWLASMRQGAMVLALGIGLIIAGVFVHASAHAPPQAKAFPKWIMPPPIPKAPPHAAPGTEPATPTVLKSNTTPRRSMPVNPGGPMLPLLRPGGPYAQHPAGMWGHPINHWMHGPRGPMAWHGELIPLMDQWFRAQQQRTAGMVAAAVGMIFALLGLVRMGFALLEKRIAAASTTP